jgi:hypothetical protein
VIALAPTDVPALALELALALALELALALALALELALARVWQQGQFFFLGGMTLSAVLCGYNNHLRKSRAQNSSVMRLLPLSFFVAWFPNLSCW